MRLIQTAGILTALYFVAGSAAARPDEKTATGFVFKSVHVSGRDYPYAVFVPRGYDSSKTWPAIVFLHGAGECGSDGATQIHQGLGMAILRNVVRWPYLVIFPQKPDVGDPWDSVDRKRLYLTGLSQGGHGTWVIGAHHPDVWAAIAPICGYGTASEIGDSLKRVPIWSFVGDQDNEKFVSETKALVETVKAAGGSAQLTIYPGVGHNSWDKAYREEKLWDWFLTHSK